MEEGRHTHLLTHTPTHSLTFLSALHTRYSPLSLALLAFLLVGMLSFLVSDYRHASFEELMCGMEPTSGSCSL